MKLTRISTTVAALIACTSSSFAQSFNVDIGDNLAPHALPAITYGAAAAQPGTWNARSAVTASAILTDINAVVTAVTLTRTASNGGINFAFQNALTAGDDDALMDDIQDIGGNPGTTTWTFNNLAAGTYGLFTYAWAPDSAVFVTSVAGGSIDPSQSCGGTWTGSHVQGVTFTRHRYNVPAGGSLGVTVSTPIVPAGNFGSLNGLQLVRVAGTLAPGFCFGDGSGTACPCGNAGLPGNGCANSVNVNGGNLNAVGSASVGTDGFTLLGTGMPSSSALYFQGTLQSAGGAGVIFGDGLRCAAGTVIRLGTKTNVAGMSQYPVAGDLSISVKGLNAPGDMRTYQCWYRNADPVFCTPSTFNLTNGVGVTWIP